VARRGDEHYVHGTEPAEQQRLSLLNRLVNDESLRAIGLAGGERILDVGCGLGQFSRGLAEAAGPAGKVIAIDRSPEQLAEARRAAAGGGPWLEFRRGDALELPLAAGEWGTFDLAHARFLLEHVTDAAGVVRSMVRAVRPGGRIVLEDDDHDLLRLDPEPPEVAAAWRAYLLSYERRGKDPFVGRRLPGLLHRAGARPRAIRSLPFGACVGQPEFDALVDNLAAILQGARAEVVSLGLSDDAALDRALDSLRAWRSRPDVALWYSRCWAEGTRP